MGLEGIEALEGSRKGMARACGADFEAGKEGFEGRLMTEVESWWGFGEAEKRIGIAFELQREKWR